MNLLLPEQFTWTRWRRCDLLAMCNCAHRTQDILRLKYKLKPYIVGVCDGSRVPCRPKKDRIAVMFYYQGHHCWTHLLREEVKLLDET